MTNLNDILNDALAAYALYFDALPDTDYLILPAAQILADLDAPATIAMIDETDDPIYTRAFYISFSYDECMTDILAYRNLDHTFSYLIAIDSSPYYPMTIPSN